MSQALCDDSSIKLAVKSLENGDELRGSMVVLECELELASDEHCHTRWQYPASTQLEPYACSEPH